MTDVPKRIARISFRQRTIVIDFDSTDAKWACCMHLQNTIATGPLGLRIQYGSGESQEAMREPARWASRALKRLERGAKMDLSYNTFPDGSSALPTWSITSENGKTLAKADTQFTTVVSHSKVTTVLIDGDSAGFAKDLELALQDDYNRYGSKCPFILRTRIITMATLGEFERTSCR